MYIYILTNKINQKQYVGQSINDPLAPRGRIKNHLGLLRTGCSYLHNAIKKYSKENFEYEVKNYGDISQEKLNELETQMIEELNTLDPNGYNLTEGGSNGKISEEVRIKIRDNNIGKNKGKNSIWYGVIGKEHPAYGNKFSEEAREKISNALRGKNNPNYNKKFSIKHREKLSESHKGSKNHNFGRELSDEHRKKISDSVKRSWKKRQKNKNKGK